MSIHEFMQALDAIRVSNSADITADHLQVALVEEDFKKAWDLKTRCTVTLVTLVRRRKGVCASCIDRLIGIASQPELSGLLILSLCLVVRSRFFIAS